MYYFIDYNVTAYRNNVALSNKWFDNATSLRYYSHILLNKVIEDKEKFYDWTEFKMKYHEITNDSFKY